MLVPGESFNGRFRIIRCIKAGGMGAVYEVLHLETQRRRALKTMLPELVSNSGYRERFRREATVAANVDSDHIVEVFDAGVDEQTGLPFILMELLKGEELGEALARRGRFEPAEVVDLLYQAGRALDRAHAAGITHRDLKPENLFLSRRPDAPERLKILDFGIAKIRGESTATGHTTLGIGSPLYMAPEQIRGQSRLGPPADVYALAHIGFTLLCGEAYWHALSRDLGSIYSLLLAKTAVDKPESASARAASLGVRLNPEVDRWFAKATAQTPSERHATASELCTELASALGVRIDEDRYRSSAPVLLSGERRIEVDETPTRPTPYLTEMDEAVPRTDTDRAVTHDLEARGSRRRVGAILMSALVVGFLVALAFGRHPVPGAASSSSSRGIVTPVISVPTLESLNLGVSPVPSGSAAPVASSDKALQEPPRGNEKNLTASRGSTLRPLKKMPAPAPGASAGSTPPKGTPPTAAPGNRELDCSKLFFRDARGIKRVIPECYDR